MVISKSAFHVKIFLFIMTLWDDFCGRGSAERREWDHSDIKMWSKTDLCTYLNAFWWKAPMILIFNVGAIGALITTAIILPILTFGMVDFAIGIGIAALYIVGGIGVLAAIIAIWLEVLKRREQRPKKGVGFTKLVASRIVSAHERICIMIKVED